MSNTWEVDALALLRGAYYRSQAELDEARAELTAALARAEVAEKSMQAWEAETFRRVQERDELRAELDRLTTMRPAKEHNDETPVLWWKKWNVEGWQLYSGCSYEDSDHWTPAPTPKEPT